MRRINPITIFTTISVTVVQSVYKRTYIKSPMELCGSIFFLAELCRAVEAGKLDVSQMTNFKLFIKS
jgi:hypothetical protein